jgi:hypothetical protein
VWSGLSGQNVCAEFGTDTQSLPSEWLQNSVQIIIMLNLLADYYNHYNPITISVFCIGNKEENGSSETSDYYLGLLFWKLRWKGLLRNVGVLPRSFVLEIKKKRFLRNVVLLSRSFVLKITMKRALRNVGLLSRSFALEIKKKRVPPKRRITTSVFCVGNNDGNGISETSDIRAILHGITVRKNTLCSFQIGLKQTCQHSRLGNQNKK